MRLIRPRRFALTFAVLMLTVTTVLGGDWKDDGRHYFNETVDSIAQSRHTHVRIVGTVTMVRKERDGDVHFRVSDEHRHFVVCEIVPYHPLPIPVMGQTVVVAGIRRHDDEAGHGWWEIHPVEAWHEGGR